MAVSGSYRTGKSSLINSLAVKTGLPVIQPVEAPDIFAELFPGQHINTGTQEQFMQTGLYRFMGRIAKEKQFESTGFLADGTALTEWAYGMTRQEFGHGAHGPGTPFNSPEYRWAVDQLGTIAFHHCKHGYDGIIHIPIEYSMTAKNNEGIDEPFRRRANEIVEDALKQLGVNYHVVRGTVEERTIAAMNALGLSLIPDITAPKKKEDIVMYDHIDNILGKGADRWFSQGFKKVNHNIHDVVIDLKAHTVEAKVDISYNGDWSKHDNVARTDVHASSIDAVLILGQLTQAYMLTADGLTRDNSDNLWLREIHIKTRKSITDFDSIPVKMQINSCYPNARNEVYHVAKAEGSLGNGAFSVTGNVCYKMPATWIAPQ